MAALSLAGAGVTHNFGYLLKSLRRGVIAVLGFLCLTQMASAQAPLPGQLSTQAQSPIDPQTRVSLGESGAVLFPRVPRAEEAPIALMLDLDSGQVLFSREADRRFMPASIVKVMSAFVAFERIENRSLTLEQTVPVRLETFELWSGVGSTMFIPQDAAPTIDELLHAITTISANDGAIVLAEGVAGSVEAWVAEMNEKAQELGMANSHFHTPNGWMDEGKTFTTAEDLGALASAMIRRHPSKYGRFFGKRSWGYNGVAQPNHDPITGVVLGADGIKTGYTNQAGHGFLGSAERSGRRLIMVVAGAPSKQARDEASRRFMEWGFANFRSRPLFARGAVVGQARVQGGSARRVPLLAPRDLAASMPKADATDMTLSVRYRGPLQAPIAAGAPVAQLIVTIDGEEVSALPLVAGRSIEKANFSQRLLNGLGGLFG
jgi:D-alanyl-D-alanine carboxypeptidase (penicillin-binding protein 5/6)